jgi:RNA polymerase sigma-70 factor (ECF subfamily)
MRAGGQIDHTIVDAGELRGASGRACLQWRAAHVAGRAFGDRIPGLPAYSFTEPARENGDTQGLKMVAPAKRVAPAEVDRARLERIFNDHHVSVWRALRRRGLAAEAAEDAAQETFLLAAERLDDIQPESERAFLIGTALRVAHTLGRKTVRWELDDDMDQRLSGARDTSESRADAQLCDLVLSKVDPDLVEVFVLYELEGLTSPEIAGLLEIPLGSVASRLRRAREQFRAAADRVARSLQKEGQA